MKTTVNFRMFQDAFISMDRADQFSHCGLGYLFDYLEQYEDDTGEEIEFDVVALCCEFSEYTYDAILQAYDTGIESTDYDDIDDRNSAIIEWLENETSICGYDDEIVVFNSEF